MKHKEIVDANNIICPIPLQIGKIFSDRDYKQGGILWLITQNPALQRQLIGWMQTEAGTQAQIKLSPG